MTKNKCGFKTVYRDAKVGDRILITACGSNEVYNKGAVFTVTEADAVGTGDVRVKEYIGSKDWFIDRSEYEVIIEEDAELTNINYGYKTVKRPAKVGESIVVTNRWPGEEAYENGAVFDVNNITGDEVILSDDQGGSYVTYSEYEVIVGNADDCETVVVTLADGTRIEGTPEQAHDLAKRLGGEEVEDTLELPDGTPLRKVKGRTPRKGDYVKYRSSNGYDSIVVGKYYEVTGENEYDTDGDSLASTLDINGWPGAKYDIYEVARDDREMSFIRAGRKVNEIEVGDIVEIIKDTSSRNKKGDIGVVEKVTWSEVYVNVPARDLPGANGNSHNFASFKLIAPVSARVDVSDSDD